MTKTIGLTMIVIGVALWAMAAGASEPSTKPATRPADPLEGISESLVAWWTCDGHGHDLVAGNDLVAKAETKAPSFEKGQQGLCVVMADSCLQARDPKPLKFGGAFSIAMWLKADKHPGHAAPLSIMDHHGAGYRVWFQLGDDSIHLHAGPGHPDRPVFSAVDGPVARDDKWHYIVGTYRKGDLTLYVDGELAGTVDGVEVAYQDTSFNLGDDVHTPDDRHFNGKLDEIMLFGRALDGREAKALHEALKPGAKAEALGEQEAAKLVESLSSRQSPRLLYAISRLARGGEAAAKALAAVKPGAPPENIAALLRQLDDDSYKVREKATAALKDLGSQAAPFLRAALPTASPEARARIKEVLATAGESADLPLLRVITALDRNGADAARSRLKELAGGDSAAAVLARQVLGTTGTR